MSRLSDKKLALLQSDYGSSLWYITKQNCSFRDLMMMASILERWNDDPNESFESFFNRVKTETKYTNYIGNSPHRALKNCEFYGIMSPSSSLKAAYTSSNLTDVYFTVKSLCNEDYEKTNMYQQIIDKQIENMNISIDGNNLKPVLFTLKVMLVVGDATGKYELSLQEFKLFVCTAKKWCQYFESAESILRSREDSDYLSAALQKYDIANDTRFNLVFKNLSYVESTTKSIIIDQNKIEEVRKKVAEFEVGEELEKKNNSKNDSKFNMPLQQIFYGAPGTGKSNTIKREVDDKGKLNYRVTFHPDSDYSTFVGTFKPTMTKVPKTTLIGTKVVEVENGAPEEKIVYRFVPQAFTKAYIAAWNTEEEVYLIIEEINRGNCAQIFGDLFQLLDRGDDGFSEYPVDADTDLGSYIAKELADSSRKDFPNGVKDGKKLMLPKNLYIWATMNTSDQSLFPIDSAFKRRWDWVYMPIDTKKDNWFIKVGEKRYSWTDFLEKINNEILTDETAEDKHLGFYFCKAENKEIAQETFVGKVLFYLWNDVFKVYGIPAQLGSSKEWAYTKFYNTDGKVNEQKVIDLMKKLGVAPEGGDNDAEVKADENSEENTDEQ